MRDSSVWVVGITLSSGILGFGFAAQQDGPQGYDDTPFLPGSRWRVHDIQAPLFL